MSNDHDDRAQFVPKFATTAALRMHGSTMSARTFHKLAIRAGLLERVTRPSTVQAGMTRQYLLLMPAAAWAGINVPSDRPTGSSCLRWRADTFRAVLRLLGQSPTT